MRRCAKLATAGMLWCLLGCESPTPDDMAVEDESQAPARQLDSGPQPPPAPVDSDPSMAADAATPALAGSHADEPTIPPAPDASVGAAPDAGPPPVTDRCPAVTALRAEIAESRAQWDAAVAAASGRYAYTRTSGSSLGGSCTATIQVHEGAVTARIMMSYQSDDAIGVKTTLVQERGSEVGTTQYACFPAYTMEQLYEECLTFIRCLDPPLNDVHVTYDDSGFLRACGYIVPGLQDAGGAQLALSMLRLGDDARDCCPLSEQPSCCVEGGVAVVESCDEFCPGTPEPGNGEEKWSLYSDDYGCPYWTQTFLSHEEPILCPDVWSSLD